MNDSVLGFVDKQSATNGGSLSTVHDTSLTVTTNKQKHPYPLTRYCRKHSDAKYAVGKNAGLVIERLRVRIPAGAAGEFSSSELTLCANSHSVSVPPRCYRSDT